MRRIRCFQSDWRYSFLAFSLVIINNSFSCQGGAICTKNEIYSEKMKECAKEHKLAVFSTLECFPIHSEEGCRQTKQDTRWLVYEPVCAMALCVPKINCTKEPQKCKECDYSKGEDRFYNLQGEIECGCSTKRGLFRVGQDCYQKYSKGKCTGDGTVMIPDSISGFKCIPSPCPKGCQWWPMDNTCKKALEPLKKVDDGLLPEKNETLECEDFVDIRSTVENCERDLFNHCKEFVHVDPEIMQMTKLDWDKLYRTLRLLDFSE